MFEFAAKVTAVRMDTLGSETTSALVATDTVIPLVDSGDFDESGGSVLIAGEVYTYSELDEGDESGIPSITLDAPGLSDAVDAETRVDSWNPSTAAVEVDWVADVVEEGTDVDGGAGEASIDHALIPLVGSGMPLDVGKSVTVRDDGNGEWTVINVRGERAAMDPGFIRTGGLGADTVVWAGTEDGRRAQLDGIDGALEAFNDANEQTVNIDGEQNYMQGSIATAADGPRVEVGQGQSWGAPAQEVRLYTGSVNEQAPAELTTSGGGGGNDYGRLEVVAADWDNPEATPPSLKLLTGNVSGTQKSRADLKAWEIFLTATDGAIALVAPLGVDLTAREGSVGDGTFRDSVDARVAAEADSVVAAALNDETSDTYAAITVGFARGQVVTHPRWGAIGDGVADDTAAIQACIDFVEAAGGGTVYFPEGDYLTSTTLVVDDHAVTLVGEGAGFESAGVTDLRASAATRIVFSAAATPAPVVRFTSVAGTLPKMGGGCVNMLLDGNNTATRCLEVLSWRGGRFDDLTLFAATSEMLFTGCISGTLSNQPYSLQHNTFIRVATSARNQTTNTAHAARLTGGQGAGATAAGNTSFNTFIGCQFRCYNANALVLEDTDNNQFIGCQAGRDTGTTYSLVLSSADQDSSGSVLTGRHARFNTFYGCEFNDGIHARAGQTGNSSSFGNQFYGLNYSNAAPQITYEAAAGGSAAANARVFSSTAAELLNATDVALGDTNANVATARTNLGTESLRIKNGSSDHVRFESGDGLSSWQMSIDNVTGNFRMVRVSGTGGVLVNNAGNSLGFHGVAPVARPAAYTQTYATASRTHAAYTADVESAAYTGAADGEAKLVDLNALRVAYENLRVAHESTKQVLNQVIDDLQAYGLMQ